MPRQTYFYETAATKFNFINLLTELNPFDRRPVNFVSVWDKEFLLGQETMEILSTLNLYEPQQNVGGLVGLYDLSRSGLFYEGYTIRFIFRLFFYFQFHINYKQYSFLINVKYQWPYNPHILCPVAPRCED